LAISILNADVVFFDCLTQQADTMGNQQAALQADGAGGGGTMKHQIISDSEIVLRAERKFSAINIKMVT
jgi:hypothetical protein